MRDTNSMDQHIYLDFDNKPDIKKSKRYVKTIGLCVIAIFTTAVLSSGLTFAVLYFNGNYNSEVKHRCSVVNISQSNEHMPSLENISKSHEHMFSVENVSQSYEHWSSVVIKSQSNENSAVAILGNKNCTLFNDKTVSNLNFRVKPIGTRCPINWYKNGDACYLILYEKRTWLQARDFCRSHGSDLISFHSKTEVDTFPKKQLKEESYWTGLSESDHKGTFKWSDGTPLDYINWNPHVPNNWNNFEHCVEMEKVPNRKWNDGNCYISQSFICKLSLTEKCGHGNWSLYNGSCYLFDDTKLSWTAARKLCLDKGADLISIGLDNELSFVLSQAFRLSTSVKWIGLNDFALIGKYKWLDGTVSKNLTWANGEPNDDNENCVFFTRLGNMYDADCKTMNGYICEKVL
ncbi:macrophage mannose receptor 1-like [Mytilus edulis]|uniref:macrophage mannose receptor 1-like n=1 Tax=Mytilus edulis TaxID=6550 RepID=UPI0039F050F9